MDFAPERYVIKPDDVKMVFLTKNSLHTKTPQWIRKVLEGCKGETRLKIARECLASWKLGDAMKTVLDSINEEEKKLKDVLITWKKASTKSDEGKSGTSLQGSLTKYLGLVEKTLNEFTSAVFSEDPSPIRYGH